jgi:CHRD domain/Putative Ig domain
MHPKRFCIAASVAVLLAAASASAQTYFSATLSNGQENPPTVPTLSTGGARPASFGTATFVLNAAQTSLTYSVVVNNIDFTGLQTPDTNDDLIAAHIHAGATVTPTTNGGVVFGFFGTPFNDNNPRDVVVTPFLITPFSDRSGGTVTGKWDAPEGNATTLAAQIPNLLAGRAYINFHTKQYGGGEIRGNIVVAPGITTSSLLPTGFLGSAYSQTLAASGGTSPYTWSVTAGALPAGLTLSSGGVLSGTPTAAGTANFTVTVSGGPASFSSQDFSLSILPKPLDFTSALRVGHVVDAARFATQFVVTNLDSAPASFQFRFWGNDGSALSVPIANGLPSDLSGTLAPGGTFFAQTAGTSAPALQGWAEVASTGRISVLANYYRTGTPANADSEASVTATQSGSNIVLPFDNTQGFVTGVAISNTNAVQAVNVTITATTDKGAPAATTVMNLLPHGHTSLVLPSALPGTAGARGSVRITTGNPDLSVVGLRFGPNSSMTSLGSGQ